MDFFARQEQARRKTKWLVIYFALAVISMICLIYGASVFAFAVAGSRHHHYYSEPVAFSFWDPQLFLYVTVGTLAVVLLGSAWKTAALSEGGSAVAESLGGRLVPSDTNNPDERRLLNVVEEMSIASGVPMPKVYVLDEEDGINAFAAGHMPSDAAVCVTRNCLTKLTRDELQGVIGHEFSHILNGDMRLNIRLIGILFGIFCIATIGRILLQARGSGRDRNPLPLIGILLLAIGSLGVLFGRLIQAAVSRQREFLADASSVQFTRNPAGLSGALQKIGGYGSSMESPHAADACHLFFANGLTSDFGGPMATHPPLDARIRAIDPTWDGKFRRNDEDSVLNLGLGRSGQAPHPRPVPPLPNVLGGILTASVLAQGSQTQKQSAAVLPQMGNPTPLHLKYAEQIRDALPDSLKAAARQPLDATAIVYALLLSHDDSTREMQLAGLAGRVPKPVTDKLRVLYPDVTATAAHARLPLVNLTLPALRGLEPGQYSLFNQTLQWLIGSDGKIELFEFVISKILTRHLAPQFEGPRKATVQFYTIKPLIPDCAVVLSALADIGSGDPQEVQNAFAVGAPYVRAPEDSGLALLPLAQCGVNQVDAALDRLALAVPIIKKNLLDAAIHVAGADGLIQESEAELLRAIADTLDCPIPPFVCEQTAATV